MVCCLPSEIFSVDKKWPSVQQSGFVFLCVVAARVNLQERDTLAFGLKGSPLSHATYRRLLIFLCRMGDQSTANVLR